ncbi:lytic transglycosylase domain-containing protein [Paraurantiacibacter namhicola]|uniref:Soluble lytic murein transglycosylase n=1 Tax=Paraurantiacibacter namhicola TaxID=645517 RepID=A0A1C7D881_9SPHN|nr:lytic transglycosylase domain-containing protein [Paraurantiacibacter namhicola]ANU07690.1 Soluble lytic murein transglycosylase precursor [Paraurantiacibacter namhicola]
MSSMVRTTLAFAVSALLLSSASPALAQSGAPQGYDAGDYDQARANMVARAPGRMAPAIAQWEQLTAGGQYTFDAYANFLLAYPGFPLESSLRVKAESRLDEEYVPAGRLVQYFDRFPPLTNNGRAQYAIALAQVRPDAAMAMAREAWRGGKMSETAEANIASRYGNAFTQADNDARMDALLWQREPDAAARQLYRTTPAAQPRFAARLAILQGGDGAIADGGALMDPGYLWNRSRELRLEGRPSQAVSMHANRAPLAALPFDETAWVEEVLAVAKIAGARDSVTIAGKVDDAFPAGTDISAKPYKLRDDYTTLMWLGGTNALWQLGDGRAAAPLFYRYGAAARTPQTRSKGFFWAGEASARGGDRESANRYWEMAAQYPDRFYGMMSLNRLGRAVPMPPPVPQVSPTPEERAAFQSDPLTAATVEVSRTAPWRTGIRFYREIANRADTPGEHMLVAELARDIGRRDLAVNMHDAAAADGHQDFVRLGFPVLNTPPGTDWTLVHAITRQESQFAQNAISHAGARGLMQLMPATAREEAGKAGMAYMTSSLIDDPRYNIRLGSNHIQRLLAYYDGSYPLAIAAYNAGPGNVNKWLRRNGDPRTGSISWEAWIEQIPFFETKNYVQRVLENAVVYELLYPDRATYGRSRTLQELMR